jgi:hypothetical protein
MWIERCVGFLLVSWYTDELSLAIFFLYTHKKIFICTLQTQRSFSIFKRWNIDGYKVPNNFLKMKIRYKVVAFFRQGILQEILNSTSTVL